jgi:hypothetical protein
VQSLCKHTIVRLISRPKPKVTKNHERTRMRHSLGFILEFTITIDFVKFRKLAADGSWKESRALA